MALIYLRHTSHSNSSMKSHWYTDGLHLNRGGRRLKGKSQSGGYKKAKHAKFSEKQTCLTP